MSTGTVQIPVLFDMSGDTIVFGEDGVGDFVSSHLDFLLDMTTEANDISLNAADISSAILIGDQDDGDSIFYAGGTTGNIAVDNLCNRIANAITRGKLVHIPKSGNTSNSGIPMGGRSLLYNASGQIQDPGEYAIKYNTSVAPIGDEQMLGQAMARVASVHLVGHPLSSGIFSDASQTQTDLETASGQTFNSGGSAFYNALAVQLSKVLGGSKSSAPMNSGFVVDATPKTTVEYTRIHIVSPNNPNTITIIDEDNLTGQSKVDRLLNATLGYSVSWASYDKFLQTTGVLMDDADQGWGPVPVTTLGDSTTIRGPWFRVDLGAQLVVSKLALGGVELYEHHLSVKEGTLLGSNDDSTWASVHTYSATSSEYFTGGTPTPTAADLKLNVKTLSSPTTYRYWRFVITSLLGSSDPLISPTDNYGYVSQFVLYDNNNNDITTLSEAGTTNPYTPILTASEDDGGKATGVGKTLQDNNFTTYWQVHSPSPFTTDSAGVTSISRGSTDLVGGGTLAGPWIGYDLGAATTSDKVGIALYDMIANESSPNMNKAPKDITILGSSDDTNWNVVETITNIPILNFLGGAWVGAAITLNEIEFTEATYRYWRVSFQATHAPPSTTAGDQRLRLSDVTFFKTDAARSTQGPLDASGTSVPALKSIYEQLMNVPGRSQIMQTRDISGVVDNSNTTLTGGFPFIAGDKLVMYLRPKIQFAAQTFAEQNTVLTGFPVIDTFAVPVYDIGRKSTHGGVAGFTRTYSESSSYNADMGFDKCFENSSEPWSSGQDKYAAAAPHDHNAGDTTTNVDGSTTLSGSWGQVDLGENTSINKFTVETVGYINRRPDEYSLLGSLDGTNWTTIKYVTAAPVGNDPSTFILNELHGPYRYYRLSIKSVDGGDKMVFMTGLLLYGAKHPSEVAQVAGVPTASAVTDISGLITNVTATAANIETAFPGNATIGNEAELNKWGWMGSANSDSLTLDTTDTTDIRTIDLHIWKITITL